MSSACATSARPRRSGSRSPRRARTPRSTRFGALEVEPGHRRGELVRRLASRSLRPRRARARGPRASSARLPEVAEPPRDRARMPSASKRPTSRLRKDGQRQLRELARAWEVGVAQSVTSASAFRAQPWMPGCRGDGLLAHRVHLDRDRREVGEPPGGAGGAVAAHERRLELGRAEEQPPRRLVCLARERTAAGRLERGRGRWRELRRHRALELGHQRRGAVEVRGADLEELLPRPLVQPVGDRWWSSARAAFGSPEYATSRIRTCLKR